MSYRSWRILSDLDCLWAKGTAYLAILATQSWKRRHTKMTNESCKKGITDERLLNIRHAQAEAKRFADGRQMLLFSERDLKSISVEVRQSRRNHK